MKFSTACKSLALGSLMLASANSMAAVIASTDFDGRTVSGSTASDLTWVTQGVANPGDVSADFALFDTAGTANRFGVDRNLHNESSWSANVALNVLAGNSIALSNVSFDAFIINNAGALQTVQRNLSYTAALLDSAMNVFSQISVNDIYGNSGSVTNGQNIMFDFSGNTLSAGNTYTLRITASGTGPGNNAALDNLVINGEVTAQAVSEPSLMAIFGLGFLMVMARRFRK
ncbi:hypothetical protein [Glaciecola sp. SC05]|uniref:hypothetical protein n=1 Tax=Glaciecola sp. SC05 TaxID=1987355 RepID=UPI0035299F04